MVAFCMFVTQNFHWFFSILSVDSRQTSKGLTFSNQKTSLCVSLCTNCTSTPNYAIVKVKSDTSAQLKSNQPANTIAHNPPPRLPHYNSVARAGVNFSPKQRRGTQAARFRMIMFRKKHTETPRGKGGDDQTLYTVVFWGAFWCKLKRQTLWVIWFDTEPIIVCVDDVTCKIGFTEWQMKGGLKKSIMHGLLAS